MAINIPIAENLENLVTKQVLTCALVSNLKKAFVTKATIQNETVVDKQK